MVQLYFYPVGSDSYLVVALVALALFGLLAVGPGVSRVARRRRWILASLRAAAILAVLFAMLRPTLVYTTKPPWQPRSYSCSI